MSDAFAYDVVDYPPMVHPQMHPSRLAAIARLHGIPAASPRACRLLEIGCGDGLQLLTLAMAYPDSRFVGVDLSSSAIARGEAMRAELGLENLRLVAADLLDWDPPPGPFDYIVAHGFFSWVPEGVRDRLLRLCGMHLADAGIAYVSYNAMPGCHLRRMLRDMLRFHVRDTRIPAERVARAREFLLWVGSDALPRDGYQQALRSEAENLLRNSHESVLFHDDLAEINVPFTISDFADLAGRHGLAFLAEADYHESTTTLLASDARERLEAIAGDAVLDREQYFDFLKGRRFRQTLLCRRTAAPAPAPPPPALDAMEAIGQLHAELPAGAAVDLAPGVAVRFVNPDGAALTTDHPVVKAAIALVGAAFPLPRTIGELLAASREMTASTAPFEQDRETLAGALASAFGLGLVVLHCDAPRFALEPPERPLASPLARLQIEAGQELVASLRPSLVRLDSALALELVKLLDGTRDREAILRDLACRMSLSPVPAATEGEAESLRSADWWRQHLAGQLEAGLRQAGRMALLLP